MVSWLEVLGFVVLSSAGLVLTMVLGFAVVMAGLAFGAIGLRWSLERSVDVLEAVGPPLARCWAYVSPPLRRIAHIVAGSYAFIRRVVLRIDARLAAYPRAHRATRVVLRVTAWTGAIAAAPVLALCWYLHLSSSDVPDPSVILGWRPSQIGYVYDRNGLVTVRLATTYRETVASEYVPEIVRQALVSAEDKRFWDHNGWDRTATFRSAGKFTAGSVVEFRQQGGSTITQQVARNLYLEDWLLAQHKPQLLYDSLPTRIIAWFAGPVRTNIAVRKLREIKYAIRLERSLTRYFVEHRPKSRGFRQWLAYDILNLYDGRTRAKELILGTYANLVYLGNGVYGVNYGARFYFGKDLDQLTADEAAFLASVIPLPGNFALLDDDPENRSRQIARRNAVLDRMAANGYLDAARLAWLKKRPIALTPPRLKTKTDEPAVVSAMLDELVAVGFPQQDIIEGRVRVHLTADRNVQSVVNAAVLDGIFGTDEPTMPGYAGRYGLPPGAAPQAAVVVLRNADAAVLSLFGGLYDERLNNYAQFNRATQARRQPGSTMKVIDILALVSAGQTPDSLVFDGPYSVNMGGWYKPVQNYDKRYLGWIPLREAIARSRNVPVYRAVTEAGGHEQVIRWARAVGIRSRMDPVPSVILGSSSVTPLEMTNAFRTVVTGRVAEPYLIDAVTDPGGSVLYRHMPVPQELGIPPEQLEYVQELLRGTVRLPHGTAQSLDTSNFPIQVLAKTGTSSEYRDAWFIVSTFGTDGVTVGVWVGYDDFSVALASGATGASVALPVAREILLALYGPGGLLGNPPLVPRAIEQRIDAYRMRAYPDSDGFDK